MSSQEQPASPVKIRTSKPKERKEISANLKSIDVHCTTRHDKIVTIIHQGVDMQCYPERKTYLDCIDETK